MSSATYTSFDVIVVITYAVCNINRKMENFEMFRNIMFVIYNFIISLISSKKFPL